MFISPAYAQAAGATAPDAVTTFIVNMFPLVLIFAVFWFLIFRPQQQRAKAHRTKLEAVKKNDQVVTGGGLIGKIVRVDGDTVEVELGPNMRVKALKATLTDVTSANVKAAND